MLNIFRRRCVSTKLLIAMVIISDSTWRTNVRSKRQDNFFVEKISKWNTSLRLHRYFLQTIHQYFMLIILHLFAAAYLATYNDKFRLADFIRLLILGRIKSKPETEQIIYKYYTFYLSNSNKTISIYKQRLSSNQFDIYYDIT